MESFWKAQNRWVAAVIVAYSFVYLTAPCFATWTLALIPIRLARPRPVLRRLARQPGMAAACAAVVALVFFSVHLPCVGYVEVLYARAFVDMGPSFLGLAVLVAWTTLLLGGRWRSESSWIDRLGRALTIYRIIAALVVLMGSIMLLYAQGLIPWPPRVSRR